MKFGTMSLKFRTRDGPWFGQTEEDFRLRFGLSVNRIFGSENEEEDPRRNRTEHKVCGNNRNFFFGGIQHRVVNGTKDRKSVFNSTSE